MSLSVLSLQLHAHRVSAALLMASGNRQAAKGATAGAPQFTRNAAPPGAAAG